MSASQDRTSAAPTKLPRGVVLDKDGKPCRTCMSASDWASMSKLSKKRNTAGSSAPSSGQSFSRAASSMTAAAAGAGAASDAPTLPEDCPPDVDRLGNHTWTLLHSMAASYPETPSRREKDDMRTFFDVFSRLYPCGACATDFQQWMSFGGSGGKSNEPRLESRDELGRWLCNAHNEVNRKLGKSEFDCTRWQERWRTGWQDGSCD